MQPGRARWGCTLPHAPKTDTLSSVAGTDKSGFTGNGGALEAGLAGPKAVGLDAVGDVHLTDTELHLIRGLDLKKATTEVPIGNGKKGRRLRWQRTA